MLLDTNNNRSIVDFFRAVGIILVISFHAVALLANQLEGTALQQFIGAVPDILNIAWQTLGSELIFLFSGFLLSYLLLRELKDKHRIDVRDFYVRRFSRIVPLYVLSLLLYAIFREYTFQEFLLNLLFVSKLFGAETIIPIGWSLEVLVQLYVLLPFLVLLLARSGHAIKLTVLLIAISLAARFAALSLDPESYRMPIYQLLQGVDSTETQEALYYHLVFRATPFLLGFLMAYVTINMEDVLKRLLARKVVLYMATGLAAIATVVGGCLPIHDSSSFLYVWFDDRFWLLFWMLHRFVFATGVCLLALCLWYTRLKLLAPVVRLSRLQVWHTLARNIYAIYLFHPVFLVLSAVIVFRTLSVENIGRIHVGEIIVIICLTTISSSMFGSLIARYFEIPWQRRIRKSFRRDPTDATMTTTD